ncbi:hypothetical protein HPB50_011342 [Hyalomma asiaticum]|uniref:Uncharacterized protein n=1 Tax=Hyalomma asiaticum TaxID=266040 RepID=A0ACB7S022_HYAAI|nr:hypothetical protein HPB50_011342 [Hyalomma asiaticum]
MSVGQAQTPATLRSILVDSSRRKSDRVHTGPDEFSSSSRPRLHSQTSRMWSVIGWTAGARGAMGCCAVIISLLLLLAVLLFPRSGPVRHRIPCWGPSCRAFVDALAASINASRDACQDFHNYVCDGWRPRFGGRSMLEDAAIGFRRSVGERVARTSPPRQSQSSHDKAVMLYKSCLAKSSHRLDEFKRFLRDRRLPWPKVDKQASLVEVVMDLIVNWHFPVFFYVYHLSVPAPSASTAPKLPSARIVFTDDFLGLGPRLLQNERELRKNNTEHICRLRDALVESSDEESDAVSCQQLDQLQKEVLGNLTASAGAGSREDEPPAMYNGIDSFAGDLTPSVSGYHWFWLLTRHKTGVEFSPATARVEVRNRRQMRTLGGLFGSNQQRTDLLRVTGLCVVQGLGRFASDELAALIYEDQSARAARHSDLCYEIVDRMVPGLLPSPYIALLLDSERVAKATKVFDAVKRTVSDSLRRANWLNNAARSGALARVKRSVLTFEAVLTDEAAGKEEPFKAVTAKLPDLGDSFIDNISFIPRSFWDDVHRSLTTSSYGFGPGTSFQSMRDPVQRMLWWGDMWRQPDASAVAMLSRDVILPNLYMLETVFPAGAYESINYGVVGSLLARHLMAMSFKSDGTKSSGSKLQNIATNDSVQCIREAFLRIDPNDTESGENPRDLEAMLVAVASLKPLFDALSVSPGYPDWSLGFSEYSAEQLFFLALCFPSCASSWDRTVPGSTNLSRASWCNVPLILFDGFGEAFRCSPGQTMNPRSKCAAWRQ